MSDQLINRSALFFMVAVGAVAANLWARHNHAPAPQRAADTTLAVDQQRIAPDNQRLLLDKTETELKAEPGFDYTKSVNRLRGTPVVEDAGDAIGEIKDVVVSTGEQDTRAVAGLDEEVGAAEGP